MKALCLGVFIMAVSIAIFSFFMFFTAKIVQWVFIKIFGCVE